ncbi:serine/threonine-protein kinase mos [Chironomus tepperi]|uniref:serine/threonine-protein kinase mos n=1 Tax=Chironomus tepperi TaxID=113505 RepID=UPI00391F6D5B
MDFDTPKRECLKQTVKKIQQTSVILGRGSFGIVFKALYRGKMVAVKIISKCDGYKFSSINRERNILHLSNQNIIKILKIVDSKDYGAIIMERFESSRNLQFILDHCDNKIDLIHRLKILKDIASALHFCHRNNIIHRDLKPDNLMIVLDHDRNDYICKLFDFGCSYKINNNSSTDQDDMLKNGHEEDNFNDSIVGTVRYSAPELLQGTAPTSSIDVYSFGIVMWQLKENEIPYQKIKSNDIIIWQVVKNNLRPDSSLLLLNELNEKPIDIRRDDSNKQFRMSLEVKSLTPKKLLIKSNEKSSRSDFKQNRSKCVIKGTGNVIRKSLFRSKFLDSLNNENEVGDESTKVFINFLTDQQFYLRKPESLFKIENEYIRLYKACWDEKHLFRPDVEKICNLIEKFINYL